MISEKVLKDIGFEKNPNSTDYLGQFDEWRHKDQNQLTIGESNGEGYIIEGIDFMEPIDNKEKLLILTNILLDV